MPTKEKITEQIFSSQNSEEEVPESKILSAK